MAASSHYEIEFRVKGDGTVTAKVDGLMNKFMSLSNAIEKVNRDIIDNGKTLTGTVRFYDQQIAKMESVRDATQNTTEGYKEATAAIDKLKTAKAKLVDQIKKIEEPMAGTLAAFNRELNVLNEQQQTLARSSRSWQKYQKDIDQVKGKINELTGVTKVLEGTVSYYDEQIAKSEKLRNATAKTSEAYREQTAEINRLKAAKAELSGSIKEIVQPMEGTLAAYRNEIKVLRDEQQQVAKNNTTWQEYEDRILKVKNKVNDLTGATKMSVKPNQDLVSNAGLAGATLTEFSRTISDLPYGIQGVANNLGQLSTLFITFASKSGGFKNAIAGLVTQLTGPLGWILAIQGAITALEFFSKAQDKAKRSSNELEIQITNTTTVIKDQEKALQDKANKEKGVQIAAQLSLVAARNFLKTAKEGMDEFTDEGIAKAESALLGISNMLKGAGVENAKLLADETIGVQQRIEIGNILINQANKRREIADAEKAIFLASAEITNIQRKEAKESDIVELAKLKQQKKDQQDIVSLSESAIVRLNTEYRALDRSLATLSNAVILQPDKEAESANDISTIIRDLQDELATINKDAFDAQRIEVQQEYRDTLERIEKEKLSVKEAEEARALAAELRKQKIDKINEEQTEYELDLTEKNEREMSSLKDKTSRDAVSLIEKETSKRINSEKKAALENIKDKKLLQAEFNRIDQENIRNQIEVVQATVAAGIIGAEVGSEVIEKLNSKLMSLGLASADSAGKPEEFDPKKALSAAREVFNAGIEAAQAALDAELSIEEAKTAKLNNELRKRLDNENLSVEQRKQINEQITKNEEELQRKRDKIAEKSFKLQKTLSIANTLISTYEMAVSAYNALAKIPIVGPALGSAAAAAATLFGLKQVDAISRQQFVPSAAGGRGDAGGSAVPIQAPDFNVVGQSQTSQLAALVQGQLDKPVKTYVVASDVTTAQELERNRISAATI
jgi:septal ring factor EnvC (AmiA/AmiB activator)